MQEHKIIEMINLYFDGELNKSEEVSLFSLLTADQNGREYFKQLNVIRNAADNSTEELPAELEERILRSVGTQKSAGRWFLPKIRMFSAISYAAALLLLFISGYLFFKVSSYQERVDNLSNQMTIQSRTIEMLFNSLPGVEVRATFDNEIIIKPNI